MKLNYTKEWFEARIEKKGNLEVGALGTSLPKSNKAEASEITHVEKTLKNLEEKTSR
jgi:hypothetical protein